jgi:hypothetical protein
MLYSIFYVSNGILIRGFNAATGECTMQVLPYSYTVPPTSPAIVSPSCPDVKLVSYYVNADNNGYYFEFYNFGNVIKIDSQSIDPNVGVFGNPPAGAEDDFQELLAYLNQAAPFTFGVIAPFTSASPEVINSNSTISLAAGPIDLSNNQPTGSEWSTLGSNIISVDSNGVVKPIAIGQDYLTVTEGVVGTSYTQLIIVVA